MKFTYLLIPFAFVFSSCQNTSELEEQISDLTYKIESLEKKNSSLDKKYKAIVKEKGEAKSEMADQLKALQEKIDEANAETEAAVQKAEQIQSDFESYKAKYRASLRKKLKGKEIGDLVLANGKKYTGAKITSLDDGGFLISHSGGMANIRYIQLPESARDAYGYEPKAAARADALKQQQVANLQAFRNRDAQILAQQKAAKQQALENKASADKANQLVSLKQQVSRSTARIEAIESEIRDKEQKHARARALGNSSSHLAGVKQLQAEKRSLESSIIKANALLEKLGGSTTTY